MEKLSTVIKIVGYLDYLVSASVLAYGIYVQSLLYCAAGGLGLIIAYLRPAERVKALLMRKVMKRSAATAEVIPHFEVSLSPPSLLAVSYTPRRRYVAPRYFVGYEVDRPKARLLIPEPQNYCAVLRGPGERFNPGIKPDKIVPR